MSDCLYPDLWRSGYVKGCRCQRHRGLNSRYQAKRQRDQRARRDVRALGGGNNRALGEGTAIMGVNCLDPGPLLRHGRQAGLLTSAGTAAFESVADRMGIPASALEARIRFARERGWMSEKHIDELCVAMHTHPAVIYGSAWYGLVCQDATLDELASAGIVPTDEQEAA